MTSVGPVTSRGKPIHVDPILRRAGYPEVKLDPQQMRKWGETLAAVNWIAPGFTHLLYSKMNKRGDNMIALFTEAIPCAAATDGIQLLFKPSEFFAFTLMERVFAVCHEISHCVGDHCGMGYQMKKRGYIIMGNKKLPYDPMFANIVQDFIINDMLIESQFGHFKKGWLHDKSVATYMDDWVEVYFKHYKKPPTGKKPPGKKPPPCNDGPDGPEGRPCDDGTPQEGKGEPGEGTQPSNGGGGIPDQTQPGPGQFDQHLDPGASEGQTPEETPPRDVQEWQQAVAEALAVAQAQGKCPAAFEQHFGKMLEPKVDWTQHIRGLVARKVGSGGYDFRRPDRRLIVRDIVCPGRSGHGAGTIVIAYDTSGSIFCDPTLIDRFKGETMGIFQDVRPKGIWMLECDAKVHRGTFMTDAGEMAHITVLKGGGGTDFRPVFQWIEEQGLEPDVLLYLTDGFGDFPETVPNYPVIWGNISPKGAVTYPFGDVVDIPTEDAE